MVEDGIEDDQVGGGGGFWQVGAIEEVHFEIPRVVGLEGAHDGAVSILRERRIRVAAHPHVVCSAAQSTAARYPSCEFATTRTHVDQPRAGAVAEGTAT